MVCLGRHCQLVVEKIKACEGILLMKKRCERCIIIVLGMGMASMSLPYFAFGMKDAPRGITLDGVTGELVDGVVLPVAIPIAGMNSFNLSKYIQGYSGEYCCAVKHCLSNKIPFKVMVNSLNSALAHVHACCICLIRSAGRDRLSIRSSILAYILLSGVCTAYAKSCGGADWLDGNLLVWVQQYEERNYSADTGVMPQIPHELWAVGPIRPFSEVCCMASDELIVYIQTCSQGCGESIAAFVHTPGFCGERAVFMLRRSLQHVLLCCEFWESTCNNIAMMEVPKLQRNVALAYFTMHGAYQKCAQEHRLSFSSEDFLPNWMGKHAPKDY